MADNPGHGTNLPHHLGTRLDTRLNAVVIPWRGLETNLVLALDADLGVTVETGVSLWSDQSDQGNDLTQSTTSLQPAYTTHNGLNVVSFDGTDDYLENTAFAGVTAGNEFTFFVVYSLVSTGGTEWVMSTSDVVGTNNQGMQFLQNAAGGGRFEVQHNGQATSNSPSDTNTHVFTITGQTTLLELYQDGVSVATDTTPTITLRDVVQYVLGARPARDVPGAVRIHSALLYNTLLSAGDINTLESNLGSKWGVTIT